MVFGNVKKKRERREGQVVTNENEVRHCIVKYAGRLYGKKSLSVLKKKKVGVQQTPQGHHQKAVNQGDKTRKSSFFAIK